MIAKKCQVKKFMWKPKIEDIGLLRDSRCMKVKACMLGYVLKQSYLLYGNR
jgi:hypothetical protein